MFLILLGFMLLAGAAVLYWSGRRFTNIPRLGFNGGSVVCLLLGLLLLATTSIVFVPEGQVGLKQRIYGGNSLENGAIIALNGEKGYQADILRSGFQFSPFIRVINDITYLDTVNIPPGFYGQISAVDGKSLGSDEVLAPSWNPAEFDKMLDAGYFLRNGGRKGVQTSVLSPGSYAINLHLFNVAYGNGSKGIVYRADGKKEIDWNIDTSAIQIPTGFVGVVRSNVTENHNLSCSGLNKRAGQNNDGISVTLVPRGCKGVWNEVLLPGAYYLNKRAYEITVIDTRLTTWEYKGGFERRLIDIVADQDGKLSQTARNEPVVVSAQYADPAIYVKVEGWDIPIELRVVVQVDPDKAPIVAAGVGDLRKIEDSIITPMIRSVVRNVAGAPRITIRTANGNVSEREMRVLDLVEQRESIEATIEEIVRREGNKAGIDIREVRIGEVAIPPELLIARRREQLARQIESAQIQEEVAQRSRIKTAEARATADQQGELVKSKINLQRAQLETESRQALGRAERLYLQELSAGQQSQANVLGADRVLQMQQLQMILGLLEKNPTILGQIKLPQVVSLGGNPLDIPSWLIGEGLKHNSTTNLK